MSPDNYRDCVLCDSRKSHFPAFLSTFPACFSTFFTMLIIVFATFLSTLIAHFSTMVANVFCHLTSQAHKLGGSITQHSAFHIQLNTLCHHFYIFFLCA